MFPRALSPCSSSKRRLFCQNQHIFIYCLPIDFFYFEDFRWSIFGKIIGQKPLLSLPSSSTPIYLKMTKSVVTIFYFWRRVGERLHLIFFRFYRQSACVSFVFFLSHAHFRVFCSFRCCYVVEQQMKANHINCFHLL